MRETVLLSCICLLLLVSLAAVPVLAATTVTCPSSCSCLLPAEAKKIGSAGYCHDIKRVCDHDSQKNEKFCYEKPRTTTPPLPVEKCASGCTCLSSADGKGKGLLYCGGKQVSCGDASAPKYCFALPTTTTTKTISLIVTGFHVVTTTPASNIYDTFGDSYYFTETPCTAPCTCLDPDAAKASGLSPCSVNASLVCGFSDVNKIKLCYVPNRTMGLSPAAGTTFSSALPACPKGCSCLATDKADAAGLRRCSNVTTACDTDPLGRPMYCYTVDMGDGGPDGAPPSSSSLFPSDRPILAVERKITTPVPAPSGDIFSSIGSLFASFFGGGQPLAEPGTGVAISCTAGKASCNGTCIDVRSDRTNCGGCDRYCLGPEQCCEGVCTDVYDSPDNCMVCGNSCPAGMLCWNRSCIRTGCGESLTNCDGACAQTRTDPENCGYCGHRCGDAQICVNGACSNCFAGTIRCGNSLMENLCVNISTSYMNCGACRHLCSANQLCSGGTCVTCTEGTTACASIGCFDLQSDENNCGVCFRHCQPDENCIDGACRSQGLMNMQVAR